mgnify:CR=1 FL=1
MTVTAPQTKLENEKQNLVRVNDILSELEKQVGPLEKQSEVAKVYLRKKEELKSLDINVFLLENKRLREQLASAEEKYNLASTELGETGEKYEGIKEEYERIQQEIESLEDETDRSAAQIGEFVSGPAADVLIVDEDLAATWCIDAADEVQQRRFPAARRTGDRQKDAWIEGQGDVFQGLDFLIAKQIILVYVF